MYDFSIIHLYKNFNFLLTIDLIQGTPRNQSSDSAAVASQPSDRKHPSDHCGRVTDTSDRVTDTSERVTDTSDRVTDISDHVTDTSVAGDGVIDENANPTSHSTPRVGGGQHDGSFARTLDHLRPASPLDPCERNQARALSQEIPTRLVRSRN